MRKSGSVRREIDLSDNLQENTDYETGCTRNGLREGESTGTVFLRLLKVRGPRRSLSLPPTSKCTVSSACAWGEPVSTTKTPSRLTARNYDYRREKERMQLEKLRARSFIPSKKSVSATSSRSITVHSVNLVEGDIWGPASRKFVPILCISDNSGNKGWSEMMAWRAFTPESTTLHNTCMQKSVVVERMIKKPRGYPNKLNSNF